MGALLTAQDVAARWSCDDSVVHKLAARRLLRGLKFGRMWRFRLEDVEAYEAARVVEPAAPERQRTARTTATANAPAADLGGEYRPVVSGPVPWRSSVVEAASPAARRGVSATTRKRA